MEDWQKVLYVSKKMKEKDILPAIGYNMNKIHHKIQAGKTEQHLFPLKQTIRF